METIARERQVQQWSEGGVSSCAIDSLKERFNEAIEKKEGESRVSALEKIIADCAAPLESGVELSPEYSAFLLGLTRMLMLEKARMQLAALSV
jgi:hypothetical protein